MLEGGGGRAPHLPSAEFFQHVQVIELFQKELSNVLVFAFSCLGPSTHLSLEESPLYLEELHSWPQLSFCLPIQKFHGGLVTKSGVATGVKMRRHG